MTRLEVTRYHVQILSLVNPELLQVDHVDNGMISPGSRVDVCLNSRTVSRSSPMDSLKSLTRNKWRARAKQCQIMFRLHDTNQSMTERFHLPREKNSDLKSAPSNLVRSTRMVPKRRVPALYGGQTALPRPALASTIGCALRRGCALIHLRRETIVRIRNGLHADHFGGVSSRTRGEREDEVARRRPDRYSAQSVYTDIRVRVLGSLSDSIKE